MRAELEAAARERVRREQEEKAKADLARQKEALRLALLERLASEEVVIERNSRWKALIPFGVGQFQNRQDGLGWFLLASETALLVGSVVAGGLSFYYDTQANSALRDNTGLAPGYNDYANKAYLTANVLGGLFAATAIAGVVQAQITFVPEWPTVRKRQLPQLSLHPIVSPTFMGLQGQF
jgi:hypothetical protein